MVSTSLVRVLTSLVMVSTYLGMVGTPEALLWGHQRRLLHRRATRDWKSESVTDLPTNGLTWVGARDTCVSKNPPNVMLLLLKVNLEHKLCVLKAVKAGQMGIWSSIQKKYAYPCNALVYYL